MIVNASIQVVPLTAIDSAFPLIDQAIALIQQSGLTYQVGPLETSIEGEYEPVQQLLRQIEDACFARKEVQFLVYTKIHLCGGTPIVAAQKTDKFIH